MSISPAHGRRATPSNWTCPCRCGAWWPTTTWSADRGRVAIERGPIVYAAEWVGQSQRQGAQSAAAGSASTTDRGIPPALLNGVEVVTGKAIALAYDAQGKVVQHRAGAHHDSVLRVGQSRPRPDDGVAAGRSKPCARPLPYPTVATSAKVSGLRAARSSETVEVIKDGEIPTASNDHGVVLRLVARRAATRRRWITLSREPATGQRMRPLLVRRYGPGRACACPPRGGCYIRTANEWKPVRAREPYGVEKDAYNRAAFEPVSTSGLRLEVTMQNNWSAGIQQWRVK